MLFKHKRMLCKCGNEFTPSKYLTACIPCTQSAIPLVKCRGCEVKIPKHKYRNSCTACYLKK